MCQNVQESSFKAEGPCAASSSSHFSPWSHGPLLLGPCIVRQNTAASTGYLTWTGAERAWRSLRTRDATPGGPPQCAGVAGAGFLVPSDQEAISEWLVQLPFSKVWQLTFNLEPFWLTLSSNHSVTIQPSPHDLVLVLPARVLATS